MEDGRSLHSSGFLQATACRQAAQSKLCLPCSQPLQAGTGMLAQPDACHAASQIMHEAQPIEVLSTSCRLKQEAGSFSLLMFCRPVMHVRMHEPSCHRHANAPASLSQPLHQRCLFDAFFLLIE